MLFRSRIFTIYIVFDDFIVSELIKYACIDIRKSRLDSRENISLPKNKNVKNIARHFNSRWK